MFLNLQTILKVSKGKPGSAESEENPGLCSRPEDKIGLKRTRGQPSWCLHCGCWQGRVVSQRKRCLVDLFMLSSGQIT